MPNFDGTGPLGKGPFTGRGQGFCVEEFSEDSSLPEHDMKPEEGGKEPSRNTKKEVTPMPRGDGTGPAGMGPMTGRAAGYCAGYAAPGYMNPIPGRGAWAGPMNPGYASAPYAVPQAAYGPATAFGPVGYGTRLYAGFGRGFGRGFRRGFGGGFGRGRW